MTALPLLLLAAVIIVAGAHVAISAAGFVAEPWLAGAGGSGSMGSVFFAPFALIAIAAPCVAAPLSRRLLGRHAFAVPGTVPAALILFFLCEAILAGLVLLVGASPSGTALPMHAVLLAYSAIAAWLFQRRTEDDDANRTPAQPG